MSQKKRKDNWQENRSLSIYTSNIFLQHVRANYVPMPILPIYSLVKALTLPVLGQVHVPRPDIPRLLGIHAKRALALQALGGIVVRELGGDELLGRRALLDPLHDGEHDVVVGVLVPRDRVRRARELLAAPGYVPRRRGRARAVAHPRDQEEPEERVEVHPLRRERLVQRLVEHQAAADRDQRVRPSVVHEHLAPLFLVRLQRREVVRRRVPRVDGVGGLDVRVRERRVVPLRVVVHEVLEQAEAVVGGRAEHERRRCAQRQTGKYEGLVRVHPVGVSRVDGLQLLRRETVGRVGGGAAVSTVRRAQEGLEVEVAARRVADDLVRHAVLRVALLDHLRLDGREQRAVDVAWPVFGQVVQRHLETSGCEVRCPPG